jgi:trehalose 6-phosphate synthase/phosphatase
VCTVPSSFVTSSRLTVPSTDLTSFVFLSSPSSPALAPSQKVQIDNSQEYLACATDTDDSEDGIGVRCRWQTLTEVGDQSWKQPARLLMDIFVQRTHGTYVEEKSNALI